MAKATEPLTQPADALRAVAELLGHVRAAVRPPARVLETAASELELIAARLAGEHVAEQEAA